MRKFIGLVVVIFAAQNLFANTAVINTERFALRFAADGKPASFKLSDGMELLDVRDPGRGFYLQNASKAVIDMPAVWVRNSNELVVESDNRTQQVIFDLTTGDQYVGLRIKRLKGIPKSSALTLHFEMNTGGNV
ncbi:hypothetical protein P4B35_23740, partial [Pontiellaceae bacterium B12227]|nr:hypothetical protein [Pontiellaceae bacterium B12227]